MQLLIMKQDKPPHYKGDIVEIRASGTPFDGREPDSFVMVEVPDAPMTDFEHHNQSWEREIEFEVVASDPAQDGFRLRLYSSTANNGLGSIAREDVEGFITAWGGTIHNYADNEVVFDITIYDALTAPAFWELPDIADQVVFTEVSYDQATGVHQIQADYSALGNNPTYVERYVKRMGLTIVSHSNKILTYDADRAIVRDAFQKDMKEKAKKQVARRRYHVPAAAVDTIIDNGGTYETDKPTLLNYVTDKATE